MKLVSVAIIRIFNCRMLFRIKKSDTDTADNAMIIGFMEVVGKEEAIIISQYS